MGFVEDMELLKRSMKQLEIEWEQWFSGALPKPPVETKKRVEDIIRRYNVKGPPNLGDASVFQMHQAKYQSYNEMWNRRVRLKEEGRLPTGREIHRLARDSKEAEGEARAPVEAPDRLRKVFDEFVAARKKAGQGTASLNYDNFKQLLTKQAEQLRKGGYRDVDFGVAIKDGKASVVARPKR